MIDDETNGPFLGDLSMTYADGDRREAHALPEPVSAPAPVQATLVPAVSNGMASGSGLRTLPPAMSMKPTLSNLLKFLQRRWLLATVLSLIIGPIIAGAAWFLMPPKYTAVALVRVAGKTPTISPTTKNDNLDGSIFQKTQAGIAKSKKTIDSALERPEISRLELVRKKGDGIYEWLEKELIADFTLSPEVMRLSLSYSKPAEAETLLQAILDSYLQRVTEDERLQKTNRMNEVRRLLGEYETKLAEKRRSYQQLQESVGVPNTGVPAKVQIDQDALSSKRKELNTLQNEILKLQLAMMDEQVRDKRRVDPAALEAAVDNLITQDKVIQALQMQITQKETELQAAARGWDQGINAPALRVHREEIAGLKAQVEERKKIERPLIAERMRKDMETRSVSRLKDLQAKMSLLEKSEKTLQQEVDTLTTKLKTTTVRSVGADLAREEMERMDGLTKNMRQIVNNLDIEMNAPSRISLMDNASIRESQVALRQGIAAGVGGIATIAIVCLIVSFLEFRACRINCSEDVTYGLGWRLVGALPALPSGGRSGLRRAGDDKYWQSLLTESVDSTRAMLLHAARTEGLKTVMVTSAVSGEGKTSLSCHLATSIARSGRKTLLIDCDLRSPAAHQLFNLPGTPGFSEVLRGETPIQEALQATVAENLWLLPAGACDSETLKLLAQGAAIEPLLSQLREQFDLIVLDSSPVLPVVDALEIGQHVDIVIFSLLRDVSRIPNVYAAYQKLSALGIRMLGAVMNGVTKDSYGNVDKYYAQQPG